MPASCPPAQTKTTRLRLDGAKRDPEVLRLAAQGLTYRQISQSVGISASTVQRYVVRAQRAGVSWPLPDELAAAALRPRPCDAARPEDTKVGERTARQYLAHLQRCTAWLEQHYQVALLEATTRDLRQYKTELGKRQKPASVNAALAALRRFYGWASDTERIARNPAQHLTDVAAQALAPKGFSDVDRRRLVRESEKAGPMADAIVILLLNTGLRVDELVTLTWQRVQLHARSGWIDVVGKGDKRRRLPLNRKYGLAPGAIYRGT